MDAIIFQNILFSTISFFLVVLTIGFIICFVLVIVVLKSMRDFFTMVKDEGQKIADDITKVREAAKSEGMKFASLAMSVISFFKHTKKSKKS